MNARRVTPPEHDQELPADADRAAHLEAEAEQTQRRREEARTVAGADDDALRTDGSGNAHASAVNAQLAEAEKAADQPLLDVGDHVETEGREATMVVVRVCSETAGGYYIETCDETVAEYNDCDPEDDVYEVVFPQRATTTIDDLERYPYPRSMLALADRVHDRDDENGGDAE